MIYQARTKNPKNKKVGLWKMFRYLRKWRILVLVVARKLGCSEMEELSVALRISQVMRSRRQTVTLVLLSLCK